MQNIAAHECNSYETRLEPGLVHGHSFACEWCVWGVLVLAVCAHRKQGVPQGSVLGLAQTPERRGGIQVWKNNSQRAANSQKQYRHKEPLAILQWKQLN